MSTQLIQVVTFTNVGAGAQVTLPHNINVNGRALIPDVVMRDNGFFTIDNVTDAAITVTNTNAFAVQTLNAWLEFKQTTQRWFGAAQTTALTPNPYVPAANANDLNPTLQSLHVLGSTILDQNVSVGGTNPPGQITNINMGTDGQTGFATINVCLGDPNGQVVAGPGSICMRIDGGAGTALYVKEGAGFNAVGWAGK